MSGTYTPKAVSMPTQTLTLAHEALRHIVTRMQADPRLAYLAGPGSEVFDQITAAVAALEGRRTLDVRDELANTLKFQEVPPVGAGPEYDFQGLRVRLDPELYIRMAQYNDRAHDMDSAEGLSTVITFFLERGLKSVESDMDSNSRELF